MKNPELLNNSGKERAARDDAFMPPTVTIAAIGSRAQEGIKNPNSYELQDILNDVRRHVWDSSAYPPARKKGAD